MGAESSWNCDYCGQPANGKGPVLKDEFGGHMHASCRKKFYDEQRNP